jgi:hypothetical protein
LPDDFLYKKEKIPSLENSGPEHPAYPVNPKFFDKMNDPKVIA